jgi:hypothetical protein
MCKMLFIGTKEKLEEVPFDKERPDLYVEEINGEFKPVADKFDNKNIYFIGTSRGCSCDFGIEKDFNLRDFSEIEIEQKIRQEKSLLNPIRQLLGTQDRHIKEKIEKTKKMVEQEQSYFAQTLKLIGILKSNTTDHSFTEMYCCWAGEYSEPVDEYKTINISQEKLEDYFDIELREKVKFIQQ